jgi:hypothetical protein
MTTSTMSTGPVANNRLAWWTLAIALICGGALRWVWIEDMEWKNDEQWSYRMSQEVGRTRPWPSVGMETSLHFPNPGLSVWTFVAIGRAANTPTSMAHAIVLLNIIGLLGFAWAVRDCIPASQREPWVWGLALQAVSPYAIRLSRKVWPPSILTPLLLLLWLSHRYRLVRWGAFTWGLVGALIGQVHLSGWFVAMGLVIGTALAEVCGSLPRSRSWHWWFLGTVLGLLPTVPWAIALPRSSRSLFTVSGDFMSVGRLGGYLYGIAAAPTSMIPYSFLGIGENTDNFLAGPLFNGIHLHFYESLNLSILFALFARFVVRLFGAIAVLNTRWTSRLLVNKGVVRASAHPDPSAVPTDLAGACPSVGFYLWSTVAIPCVLLFMATDVYFYHYYFVFCPFLFVALAVWMLPWRRVLLGVVVAQALMSCVYLAYIHANRGITRGEYGWTYARQMNR